MELLSKQAKFTLNVAKLINHINEIGYSCTFGDAYRTPEQAKANATAGKGISQSLHCIRLAVDLNVFNKSNIYLSESNDQYAEIGAYWESLDPNNRWGGNFIKHGGKINDPNHFEMKNV